MIKYAVIRQTKEGIKEGVPFFLHLSVFGITLLMVAFDNPGISLGLLGHYLIIRHEEN